MDINTKIHLLTQLHDLRVMGVELPVPQELKECKISFSILEKYPQSFSQRCAEIAIFLRYQECSKNTPITITEYQAKILTQPAEYPKFQTALMEVSLKLPQKITLKDLQAVQQS